MKIWLLWLFWVSSGFAFYVYLGYPLLLGLLAWWCGDKRPFVPLATAQLPLVSLIIAAHNEEAVIAAKLTNTLALDYPAERLQIIVAADGSDDETAVIARRFAPQGVVLSYVPDRQGKVAAINRAASLATGDIFIFSDANNLYHPQTVRELVRPFANPTVGMVSGAKRILCGDGALGASEGLYWRYESCIKRWQTVLGSSTGAPGEVMAVRRELFVVVPPGIINDDLYLALRVLQQGYNVHYAPAAQSYERVSLTAQDERTRRARIMAGHYQLMGRAWRLLPLRRPLLVWQVVSHKFARPLLPLALLGLLLADVGLVVCGAGWLWGLLLLGQFGFYGLALLGSWVGINGRLGYLFYLPTFLLNSNLAALVGLYRFLTGQQTAQWDRVGRRKISVRQSVT